MMITFDPDTHTYTIDGQQVPSVTGILADMGFIDSTWFTDYGRERGKLVHRIIHWHITGELDEATIDPALQGYFDAWLAFEKDSGFVSTETEKPMGSALHRFCGTPDHIGMIGGSHAIVDAKTGAIFPHVGLQLAGYEILRNEGVLNGGMNRCKRLALALKEDGKYSIKEFSNRQDRGIFLAALACWNWQHNNGRR
jgi:hypothetical protein